MNLIFRLSEPIHFEPLYEMPVSAEFFSIQTPSLFEKQKKLFKEFLPDFSPIVIERGEQSFFRHFDRDLDFIHLPIQRMSVFLFIWAAIAMALELDPVSLIYPADLFLDRPEGFFRQLRALLSGKFAEPSVLFWGTSSFGDLGFEMGEKVGGVHSSSFYRVNRIFSDFSEDPEDLLFFAGPVFYHHQIFLEQIARLDSRLTELFYLITDHWQNPESAMAFLPDMVEEIERYFSWETLSRFEDIFTADINSSFLRVKDFQGLFRFLPKDDDGNIRIGSFDLERANHNFLVNLSNCSLSLSHLSGVACFASADSVRIFSLEGE